MYLLTTLKHIIFDNTALVMLATPFGSHHRPHSQLFEEAECRRAKCDEFLWRRKPPSPAFKDFVGQAEPSAAIHCREFRGCHPRYADPGSLGSLHDQGKRHLQFR